MSLCYSEEDELELITLVLQNTDPILVGNFIGSHFIRDCNLGYSKAVELFLKDPRVDPSICNDAAMRYSCEDGRLEIAKLLLKDSRVNPCASNNYAIIWACQKGHWDVVSLLLHDGRADPSEVNNFLIREMCCRGNLEAVKLLARDKRVDLRMGLKDCSDEIREFIQFELCKDRLFLSLNACSDHLVTDLFSQIRHILI